MNKKKNKIFIKTVHVKKSKKVLKKGGSEVKNAIKTQLEMSIIIILYFNT